MICLMNKIFHNKVKDNIDMILQTNEKYFNMNIKTIYDYIRNPNTREWEDVPCELEVNVNGHIYVCFVKNDDKIYLKHYNLAQNNTGKIKFHIEKRSFTNWFHVLKFLKTSHLYK